MGGITMWKDQTTDHVVVLGQGSIVINLYYI